MRRFADKRLFLVALFLCVFSVAAKPVKQIIWQDWTPGVFEQARREHRFVLLDLQAVWCHWCHVMDSNTYADPKVIALINAKYIAVRVDQDARPDLSNRYEDYGWPATVVFNARGGEIVKRQGYLPSEEMISMLQAIIKDPSPGPSVKSRKKFAAGPAGTNQLLATLQKRLEAGYDKKMGGWGFEQKYLNWDNVEYCVDWRRDDMARQTLNAQLQLIDPAWGGVYQYSTDDDWAHPHFEKIMQMQAEDMRIFALACLAYHDAKYLDASRAINAYLRNFLTSPEGAFYTSQDADLIDGQHSGEYFKLNDAERRVRGIPRIDKHIYARENGWAIAALTELYSATGDSNILTEAETATDWVLKNRSLTGGGFRHDAADKGGPYLGDSLAMARAFVCLYEVTAVPRWLDHARETFAFITQTFSSKSGFVTAKSAEGNFPSAPQYAENVQIVRLAERLSHYAGTREYKSAADSALRWLSQPEIALTRFSDVGGICLALEESTRAPTHLVLLGKKSDPQAKALWQAVLKCPDEYRCLEWFNSAKEAMRDDVEYPSLGSPAVFKCSGTTCSSPIADPVRLEASLRMQ